MQPIWITSSNPQEVFNRLNRLFPFLRMRICAWKDLWDNTSTIYDENLVIASPEPGTPSENITQIAESFQAFLEKRGCLIGLADSFELFTSSFPDMLHESKPVESESISLIVVDSLLATQIGTEQVKGIPGQTVYFQSRHKELNPLICLPGQEDLLAAFTFSCKNGFVIFWGLPLELETEEQKDALFTFLITRSLTHSLQEKARERQHLERAEVVIQHAFMMTQNTRIDPVVFSLQTDKNAMVILNWEGNARLHLHIEDEHNHMGLDHSSDRSPMVWGAPLTGGEWHCQVSLISTDDAVVPVLLTVFSVAPLLRRKTPQRPVPPSPQPRRCRFCNMPLNSTMLYCPACGKKVENTSKGKKKWNRA